MGLRIVDVPNIIHISKGECFGIGLISDSEGNINFCTLVEDDGTWYAHNSYWEPGGRHDPILTPGSSFWLKDLLNATERALKWLEDNAEKHRWGWRIKDEFAPSD